MVLLSPNDILHYLPGNIVIPHEEKTVESSFGISHLLREHSD